MDKPKGLKLCSVEGCNKKHSAKGFCSYHYQKDRYYSNPKARERLLDYVKEYHSRPEIREKERITKHSQSLVRGITDLIDKDPHAVCKKLGKPFNHFHADKHYFIRCKICNVSYSDLDSAIFYKKNKCPCCHRMLRTRKGIKSKRLNQELGS